MTVRAVRDAAQLGVVLPDCVFILSTWDEPRWVGAQAVRCAGLGQGMHGLTASPTCAPRPAQVRGAAAGALPGARAVAGQDVARRTSTSSSTSSSSSSSSGSSSSA